MRKIRKYENDSQRKVNMDFSKLKSGFNELEDSVLELEKFKNSQMGSTFADKDRILNALESEDNVFLTGLSSYYMNISGIYQRLVEHMATILTYDWYAYPYMISEDEDIETIEEKINEVIKFLDNMFIPATFGRITRTILIEGSYYGYFVINSDQTNVAILDLPNQYCRSRMSVNGIAAVEFNLDFFDDQFRNKDVREAVLETFPQEFSDAYSQKESGNIPTDNDDRGHWFLCDPDLAMKFSITPNELPLFVAVIPTILNLDEAKQLDLKKTTQELLKIIIQKMPLDKNGDLIFGIEESQDMHNSASSMLGGTTHVDLLTTFAEVEVADLDSATATSIRDPLAKVERGIFNEAGVSHNLFATDGNLSLEKSIINDEAIMFRLLEDYQNRLNALIDFLYDSEAGIRISMPHLSIYNIEKKQKMYREMATNGYSKLLPAIASGMTQSEFISLTHYENEILDLGEKLQPLKSSSTLSSKDGEEGKVGAPKKEKDELSEKTIQNQESQS